MDRAPSDRLLSDDDIEAYHRDGVLVVRGVLTPEEVETAREAIADVLAASGLLTQVASGIDDPGRFVEDFRRWQEFPALEQLALHSKTPRYAAELLARFTEPEQAVRFYHDHILVKEGGTRQRTPWHQDQPYYNVDGHGTSAWIPVDPVPLAGCLELVAGSHEGPWKMPRTFLDGKAKWFPEGSLEELPDIESDRDAFDIRAADLQPGDAIFFDFLTIHGAPGFPFQGRRRVLSLRYLAGDATHAPRDWITSPPFDELVGVLPAGVPMEDPLFPVVR
ncbi:MAG: phytanoyl-CoA dioxygenase family protein [Intrasporangiaceae bacterium]|nr:phytanoyl-CoA dioxygenase family protein [Intrasporangiaceae bacterium]